jgi:hypothetical protein
MSMSKALDRIESYTPDKAPIGGVLASDAWTEIVPKTNGQPGNWRNTVADVFQLSPDGSTVYLQPRMVLNFAVERDGLTSLLPDVIPGLDVDAATGEVLTLDALKVLRRDGIINRQGNSATVAAPAGEPSAGVFEE